MSYFLPLYSIAFQSYRNTSLNLNQCDLVQTSGFNPAHNFTDTLMTALPTPKSLQVSLVYLNSFSTHRGRHPPKSLFVVSYEAYNNVTSSWLVSQQPETCLSLMQLEAQNICFSFCVTCTSNKLNYSTITKFLHFASLFKTTNLEHRHIPKCLLYRRRRSGRGREREKKSKQPIF